MKALSKNDLEQIACRVWKAYQKLPQFRHERICRIDPQALVTDLLGLKMEDHHLSLAGNILGVTSPCEVLYEAYDED